MPAPYWVSYPEMVRMAGGTPVVIDTTAEENFCISAQQLADALTPRTRMLILCTPSNPAGTVYNRQQLEALADVVRGHPRCLVVSDEIYELIMYRPNEHVSFAGLPDMWERTFTVNGVSKAFAMTGWRIGYLAAPAHFARAAAIIQSQSTSGACSVSQVHTPTSTCSRVHIHRAGHARLLLCGGATVCQSCACWRLDEHAGLTAEGPVAGVPDAVCPEERGVCRQLRRLRWRWGPRGGPRCRRCSRHLNCGETL